MHALCVRHLTLNIWTAQMQQNVHVMSSEQKLNKNQLKQIKLPVKYITYLLFVKKNVLKKFNKYSGSNSNKIVKRRQP